MSYKARAKLVSRAPVMHIEQLEWDDNTATINITFGATSQYSYRAPGGMNYAEALIWLGTTLRLDNNIPTNAVDKEAPTT